MHEFENTLCCAYLQCLLGDNYGPVPVPAAVEEEEFRQLRNELCERGEGQLFARDNNGNSILLHLKANGKLHLGV